MKFFLLPFSFCLLFTGCANVPAIIRAASHDPAKVHIEIKTLYGDVIYDRDNANAVALEQARHPVK